MKKSLEFVPFDPIITVAVLERCLLVRPHESTLAVEERERLDNPSVDFGKRHFAVAIEIQGTPFLLELPLVLHELVEFILELVKFLRVNTGFGGGHFCFLKFQKRESER